MPSVLHVSFAWENNLLNRRHSDYILAMGWMRRGWDVYFYDYRNAGKIGDNGTITHGVLNSVSVNNPDLIIFSKSVGGVHRKNGRLISSSVDPKVIDYIRTEGFSKPIIHWYLDQRFDLYKPSVDIGKKCDWFFHCASGWRLKEYQAAVNKPSSFILAPFEPSFCRPVPYENRTIPLIWMGGSHKQNKFEQTRHNMLLELIKKDILKYYFGCFGKRKIWCPEYNKMIGQSKMLLSLYAYDMPLYYSNRLSHCIGSGTVPLSYDFTDRVKMLPDNSGIFFKETNEAIDKYKYYVNNIRELKEMGGNAKRVADEYFTSDKVVDEILFTLKNGYTNLPFGESINPKNITFDVDYDYRGEKNGNIHILNENGHVIKINKFNFKKETPKKVENKTHTPEPLKRRAALL